MPKTENAEHQPQRYQIQHVTCCYHLGHCCGCNSCLALFVAGMLSKYVCCIVLICGLLEGTLQEGFTSSSFHFGSTSSGDGDVKTYRVEYSVDSETLRRALGLFFNCLTERAKQMQIEVQNPLQSVQALASQQTAQATYALSKEMSFALLNMNKGVFDVCAPDDQVPLCEEEIIGWLEFLSGIVSGHPQSHAQHTKKSRKRWKER
eukprot:TRINITY_DN16613_c0_g1_i1.p1 TRINITY_DN16613_c0_g1~~TRINITY_DN16613_c0_g1_i1.p1  ORF type:complete len:205 (-),score=12.67 TRINITY_DN16613_c0_g1_i1:18-632(-)